MRKRDSFPKGLPCERDTNTDDMEEGANTSRHEGDLNDVWKHTKNVSLKLDTQVAGDDHDVFVYFAL